MKFLTWVKSLLRILINVFSSTVPSISVLEANEKKSSSRNCWAWRAIQADPWGCKLHWRMSITFWVVISCIKTSSQLWERKLNSKNLPISYKFIMSFTRSVFGCSVEKVDTFSVLKMNWITLNIIHPYHLYEPSSIYMVFHEYSLTSFPCLVSSQHQMCY